MESFLGGTEHQLPLVPFVDLNGDLESKRSRLAQQTTEILLANNQSQQFGIGVTNPADEGLASWLYNGSLIYLDLGRPELATAECRSIEDLAYLEIAGRMIVDNLNPDEQDPSLRFFLACNNTDYFGNTFSYHENYSAINCAYLAREMIPFLVTRQIFAGAGQIAEPMFIPEGNYLPKNRDWFSIAQRSLCARTSTKPTAGVYIGEYSLFAGPSRHHLDLFHFTGGDANVTLDTTKLKIGSTALAIQTVNCGFKVPPALTDITNRTLEINLKDIATDPEFRWLYLDANGYLIRAIDIQRQYLQAAKRMFFGRDPETNWTIYRWEKVLDELGNDPTQSSVEWAIKYRKLAQLRPNLTSDELTRMDLSFHAVNRQQNLYRLLGVDGISDRRASLALANPPADTRAHGRSILIKALARAIEEEVDPRPKIHWSGVSFSRKGWFAKKTGFGARALYCLPMPDLRKNYVEEAQVLAIALR